MSAGEFDRARQLLEDAEANDPRLELTWLVRAELAVAADTPNSARAAVERAAAAVQANPLCLVAEDVATLSDRVLAAD